MIRDMLRAEAGMPPRARVIAVASMAIGSSSLGLPASFRIFAGSATEKDILYSGLSYKFVTFQPKRAV